MASHYNHCRKREENIFFVVDDDQFVSSLALTAISNYGQVYEYNSAEKVVRDYEDIKPNIVFLDIHLGSSNGIDILAKIKEIDPDAYVYMLSSDSTKDNVFKCRELKANGFIVKPFARKNFVKAVEKCPTLTPVSFKNK